MSNITESDRRDLHTEMARMLQKATPDPDSIFDGSWREFAVLDYHQQYHAIDKLARVMSKSFTWDHENSGGSRQICEIEFDKARNMFEFLATLSWEVIAVFTHRVSLDQNLSFVSFIGVPGFAENFAVPFRWYLRGSFG
jgi:hypothetical protein